MKKIILLFSMIMVFSVNSFAAEEVVKDSVKTEQSSVELYDKIYTDVSGAVKAFSDSLKIGSEHVYKILVKQQVVYSSVYLLCLIIGILLPVLFSKKLIDFGAKNKIESEGLSYAPIVVFWIISFFLIIIPLFGISDIFTGFINPEYGAIEDIVDKISDLK